MIPGLRLRSFGEVFDSFWDSLSVVLSDSISRGHSITHSLDRLLLGLWLLLNTVLLSLYSGQLYEVIISGKVIDKIETMEELYTKQHWKGTKIIVVDLDGLDFLWNGDNYNPIIADLLSRSENLQAFDVIFNTTLTKTAFESVLTGKKVIIANKLSTYYLWRKVQNQWPELFSYYTEGTDYYVSQPQRSSMPFFLFYTRSEFDEYHIKMFNLT